MVRRLQAFCSDKPHRRVDTSQFEEFIMLFRLQVHKENSVLGTNLGEWHILPSVGPISSGEDDTSLPSSFHFHCTGRRQGAEIAHLQDDLCWQALCLVFACNHVLQVPD